jgi:type VI secretion system protein ImpK
VPVLHQTTARMMTLTLGRERRPAPTPTPDSSRLADVGVRDLLHDTALLVTTLASGGSVQNAATFRERCRQLVDQFSKALARRDVPDEVQREALIAQCGLLDEMALRHLSSESRTEWELHPMQVERFSVHDAGRRVIDRIEAHLNESLPHVDLLECYAAILGMGFIGRYALEGETKRAALVTALNARLESIRPHTEEPFRSEAHGTTISNGVNRLMPWIAVALACLVAATVWITGNRVITTQLAEVVPAKVVQR